MAKTIAVADQQTTGLDRLKAQPERLIGFLKEVRAEMRKVVTPTRTEVQSTTVVVIVTVFLFAAYFFLIDSIVGKFIDKLFLQLTKH